MPLTIWCQPLNKVSYQIIAYEDTIQETPNKKKPNPYQTLLGVQYRLGSVTRTGRSPTFDASTRSSWA